MAESWRPVPGYQGDYECSDQGRVRSRKYGDWRILKQSPTRGGYLFVSLCQGGRYRHFRVNRLVLISFRGQPRTGEQACHRDGNHLDNRLANLYWGTPARNARDKVRHGTHLTGSEAPGSKLSQGQVREAARLHATGCCTLDDLAWHYGVSPATVSRAVRGVTYRR